MDLYNFVVFIAECQVLLLYLQSGIGIRFCCFIKYWLMIFSTFKKGRTGDSLSALNSFKSLMVCVVMMLMMASNAMAQDVKFEVIDGLRYFLEPDTKTASLVSNNNGKYSGDIVVPEKVKSSDEVEYSVTSLGESCFNGCGGLTSISIPSSVTSLGKSCFESCI